MQLGSLDSRIRGNERRMTARLSKAWQSAAQKSLPSWEQISALGLGADLEHCFCVDLRLSDPSPYFVFLGGNLEQLRESCFLVSDSDPVDIIDIAAAGQTDEVALTKRPSAASDAISFSNGQRFIFRSVLFPLSDNGQDVTHILGALNGKTI